MSSLEERVQALEAVVLIQQNVIESLINQLEEAGVEILLAFDRDDYLSLVKSLAAIARQREIPRILPMAEIFPE